MLSGAGCELRANALVDIAFPGAPGKPQGTPLAAPHHSAIPQQLVITCLGDMYLLLIHFADRRSGEHSILGLGTLEVVDAVCSPHLSRALIYPAGKF